MRTVSDSPRRLVEYRFPGCGHSGRITQRNADKEPAQCWPCRSAAEAPARAAEALARKRASARRSYHRAKKRTSLTEEQRTLQRRLVGFTNNVPTQVTPDWIYWLRTFEANFPDLAPLGGLGVGHSAVAVVGWLAELGIPHAVVVVDPHGWPIGDLPLQVMLDAATLTARFGRGAGLAPGVPMASLDELAWWLPSLGTKIHAALQTAPATFTPPDAEK